MKRKVIVVILALVSALGLSEIGNAKDPAKQVLKNYFKACGGLKKIRKIETISMQMNSELYTYQLNIQLASGGRFRLQDAATTTVFDGAAYWNDYKGVVDALPPVFAAEYATYTINEFFFHGLLNAKGEFAAVAYQGEETKHGETYDIVVLKTDATGSKSFYFNKKTGLLDKIIEVVPDETVHQRKIIHQIKEYKSFDGITLFTAYEAYCVTVGEYTLAPIRLENVKINERLPPETFVKPVSTVALATEAKGVIEATVIDVSPRGSIVTNVSSSVIGKLSISEGSILKVTIHDHTTSHRFYADIETANDIASGDYVASFNRTPVLWIVKAFVGMTSEIEVKTGDTIRITMDTSVQPESKKGETHESK